MRKKCRKCGKEGNAKRITFVTGCLNDDFYFCYNCYYEIKKFALRKGK